MNSSNITLWGAGTSRVLRVIWMLEELGLTYLHKKIGSRTGETLTDEYTRINPRQKIPALQDGHLILAESAAIITYLAEKYGKQTTLLPLPGTDAWANYLQWCFFIMTELDAHTLYILRRHRGLSHLYGEAPTAITAAIEYFGKQVQVASAAIERNGPYLLGEHFTGADILLTTCLDWATLYEVPIPASSQGYLERVHERFTFQRAQLINEG